jgi:type IV fimbrial biogenesis protein FimT
MKIRSRGVTLIELLTALTVLGVLMAIAAPSFRQFTANSRTTAATNQLVTALNMARSEALRRSSNVVVCTSSNQATCSGSTDWVDGWIVFADLNRNGTVDADELVQSWSGVNNGFTVSATAIGPNSAVDRLAYNTMGMGDIPAGASRVRFQIASPVCTGNRAGRTEVLVTGMIQSSKVACP